jgi:hypothetical protein
MENEIRISVNSADVCSIINNHWQDIHHSRNQDWMYWAIITAIFAGLLGAITIKRDDIDIYNQNLSVLCLLFIGGFISVWASFISWSHWVLHIRKIEYIKYLEKIMFISNDNGKKLPIGLVPYIQPKELKNADKYFVVNGLIYSMYLTIGLSFYVLFFIMICHHWTESSIQVLTEGSIKILYFILLPIIFAIIYAISYFTLNRIRELYKNRFTDITIE